MVAVSEAGAGSSFRDELDGAVRSAQEERAGVIVDLRRVSALGYLSAIALLRASYLVAAADSRLVVVAPGPKTLAALDRVGAGRSLHICTTLQEARRRLREHES